MSVKQRTRIILTSRWYYAFLVCLALSTSVGKLLFNDQAPSYRFEHPLLQALPIARSSPNAEKTLILNKKLSESLEDAKAELLPRHWKFSRFTDCYNFTNLENSISIKLFAGKVENRGRGIDTIDEAFDGDPYYTAVQTYYPWTWVNTMQDVLRTNPAD